MSGSKLFFVWLLFFSIFSIVKSKPGATLSIKLDRAVTDNDKCSKSNSFCDLSIRICLGKEDIDKEFNCSYFDENGQNVYDFVWEGRISNFNWSEDDKGVRQLLLTGVAISNEADRSRKLANPIIFHDFNYNTDRIYTLKAVMSHEEPQKTRSIYQEFHEVLHYGTLTPGETPLQVHLRSDHRTHKYLDGIDMQVQLRCMSGYYGCKCASSCLGNERYECNPDGSRRCNMGFYPEGNCSNPCIPDKKAGYECDPDGKHICLEPGYQKLISVYGRCLKKMCDEEAIRKCGKNRTRKNNYCCETPKILDFDHYYKCTDNKTICETNIKAENAAVSLP